MGKQALYVQVKDWILGKIQDGSFEVGGMIPSENELVSLFGVSKVTINKALSELVFEGYLKRVQGKGTFVQEKERISRTKRSSIGFTDEMNEKGKDVYTKPINIKIIEDKKIADVLGINSSTQIVKYERIRLIGEVIVAYQISYVPNKYLKFLKNISVEQLPSTKLYDLLKKNGIHSDHAKEMYLIHRVFEDDIMRIMNVNWGDPVFEVERRSYTADNEMYEYTKSYLKWDYYKIDVELHD